MPEGDRTDAVGNEEVELVTLKFRQRPAVPEGDRTDAVGNEEVELVQRKFRKIEILVSEKKNRFILVSEKIRSPNNGHDAEIGGR